jgi:tetratricopeptide (TPR) repeat protein
MNDKIISAVVIAGACFGGFLLYQDSVKDTAYVGTSSRGGKLFSVTVTGPACYDPSNKAALLATGKLLTNQKYQEAVREYQTIIKLSPKEYAAHHGIATAYSYLSNYDKSATHYKRALELNPKLAISYVGLVSVENARQNYDLAITYGNRAIASNPNLSIAYYNRGASYFKLHRWKEATSDYKTVIRKVPGSHLATKAKEALAKIARESASAPVR